MSHSFPSSGRNTDEWISNILSREEKEKLTLLTSDQLSLMCSSQLRPSKLRPFPGTNKVAVKLSVPGIGLEHPWCSKELSSLQCMLKGSPLMERVEEESVTGRSMWFH